MLTFSGKWKIEIRALDSVILIEETAFLAQPVQIRLHQTFLWLSQNINLEILVT